MTAGSEDFAAFRAALNHFSPSCADNPTNSVLLSTYAERFDAARTILDFVPPSEPAAQHLRNVLDSLKSALTASGTTVLAAPYDCDNWFEASWLHNVQSSVTSHN